MELTIVLAIVGLLLGGLLPTLSGQMEQQRRSETVKQLADIKDALYGHAISKGRLPCPDTDGDGNEDIAAGVTTDNIPAAGQSTKKYSCSATAGTVPYNQLGTASVDAFGAPFVYGITAVFGEKNEVYSALGAGGSLLSTSYFTLSDVGTLYVCSATTNASTTPCPSTSPRLTTTAAAVVLSRGANWGQTPSIEETENTDSDGDFISHDPTATFDDSVFWLSPSILFNRMVGAGKLP